MAELGEYLRSRRAALSPADAGLSSVGVRRVPGLRREEVALLAGVSVDYYSRLEQGRERSPSAQVLGALSAALRLDDDGRGHLFRLAGHAPLAQRAQVSDRVDPALLRLMDAWPDNPALVYNRAYDVLAANPLASALFGQFGAVGNLMLLVFTDPRARGFYRDWSEIAADSTAGFRMAYSSAPDDPRIRAVLAELLDRSDEFREHWDRRDARRKSLAEKSFRHPQVGTFTLRMQTFDVRSAPGQELVVYDAEPGSPSADALTLLGTIAATAGDQPERRNVTR
ncbi:helix-turn-helix domain-containing protein [Mycolicibacterium sp. S2-37]|uniref:helix-turn-helix domain-containing protein n=1 Tax=Mycolicibacterium sp. S2-37 TaxID=2810297 RepID=UPI001A94C3F3|nr:helix-turn-helix transcriptional regulator [Mycolicibacterium sp. S2-37]MBO0678501.1 helix-turn-helix domain-containing protein [Mycolicibacterium sp. S2-37]